MFMQRLSGMHKDGYCLGWSIGIRLALVGFEVHIKSMGNDVL
jgi:hypothetical protein